MPSSASLPSFTLTSLIATAALACAAFAHAPMASAQTQTDSVQAVERPAAQASGEHRALPPPVIMALDRAHVPISAVSVVVEKTGDASPVVAVNDALPMMPASTMKLVTTYAGLGLLGPGFRWPTRAWTDGSVDANGTLHGNLYIQGTGDPKLVPEELIDLVQKIRAAGIVNLDGALVLDKSAFDVSTRDLPSFDGDDEAPYNVGPEPLLYAYKAMTFTFSPDEDGDGDVTITEVPPLAGLEIDNQMHLRNGACTHVHLMPQISTAITSANGALPALTASFDGTYARRCGERSVNIAAPVDHTTFFADGFLALWHEAGGTLGPDFNSAVREGQVPANARFIAEHDGPALASVIHDINKFSNNTMARNLFLTLGETRNTPSTPAKATATIAAFLQRSHIPMPDLVLDNGCGLSRSEFVSARSLANLLQAAKASAVAQVFIDSLPVAGVDGTMRHRLVDTDVAGHAYIKTGSLRDVRAIAGYVSAANGNTYIVVSLINDPHAKAARAAHDALLEWVYQGMPEEMRSNLFVPASSVTQDIPDDAGSPGSGTNDPGQ